MVYCTKMFIKAFRACEKLKPVFIPDPGSEFFFIPDPGSGSESKDLNILTKNIVSRPKTVF
jgi:hypothetical protein